jgi:hypothetical protein
MFKPARKVFFFAELERIVSPVLSRQLVRTDLLIVDMLPLTAIIA